MVVKRVQSYFIAIYIVNDRDCWRDGRESDVTNGLDRFYRETKDIEKEEKFDKYIEVIDVTFLLHISSSKL